ncbi:proteophosphoglycan ppg4 [Reticulomyxa filosa]|uniref:Proteophosphoglycan ppg4 n=1 Tax=Reticulomyxa filosa TaxID=46433 RepID=X6N336_RETFI|nr:proteophosphoglycan ppg4 [Reticulomyxa filosa]|eukprot:ETO20690.1 proteophosphoglycan ppg4 [Reticulomyxa filosa]
MILLNLEKVFIVTIMKIKTIEKLEKQQDKTMSHGEKAALSGVSSVPSLEQSKASGPKEPPSSSNGTALDKSQSMRVRHVRVKPSESHSSMATSANTSVTIAVLESNISNSLTPQNVSSPLNYSTTPVIEAAAAVGPNRGNGKPPPSAEHMTSMSMSMSVSMENRDPLSRTTKSAKSKSNENGNGKEDVSKKVNPVSSKPTLFGSGDNQKDTTTTAKKQTTLNNPPSVQSQAFRVESQAKPNVSKNATNTNNGLKQMHSQKQIGNNTFCQKK